MVKNILISVKINNSIDIQGVEIKNTNFKSLSLKEEHIQEILHSNIEFIFKTDS